MAGSKKVKRKENPIGKGATRNVDPNKFYQERPAWCFNSIDMSLWSLNESSAGGKIWEILQKLKNFETQTWNDILLQHKKQNHMIVPDDLNKIAQDRLAEMHIEAEAITSLRLTGNHRLYGYNDGRVFNVIWYDEEHGDNSSCVCRSKKKHT